jgi:peptidyl-prolyl cis-trans isomerase D
MKVGEISDPVQSAYGFHIIRLSEVQPEKVKPFEEVRTDVLQRYQQQQAEPLFFEQTEQLANLAFEHPDGLQVAAETLGLPIEVTGAFDRGGDKEGSISGHQEVIDAAFSQEVLEGGGNSDLIEIDGERVIVLRVKEHFPAAQRPLADVREEIIDAIRNERARERVVDVGRDLIARLRADEDPVELAKSLGLEWSAPSTLKRGDTSAAVESGIRNTLFRMPRPDENQRQYDGTLTTSGDFVILSLDAVMDGDPTTAEAEYVNNLQDALRRDFGQVSFDSLVQSLHKEAEIKVNRDRI